MNDSCARACDNKLNYIYVVLETKDRLLLLLLLFSFLISVSSSGKLYEIIDQLTLITLG